MLSFREKKLNDEILFPTLEVAEKYKVPILMHTGYPPPGTKRNVLTYSNPVVIDDFINSYPKANIVIAHMGFPWTDIAIALASQYPNIHLDISNMVYKHFDPRKAEENEKRVYEVLGQKYKFDPKDKETLGIWDTSESEKFMRDFNTSFNMFLGIIGAISLLIGGIGLANIMYVIVQERTREIGIRRSVGAKRRHIMGQFFIESFIIIGTSAGIGFLLAIGMLKIINTFPIYEYVGKPVLSFSVALTTICVLGIIGFFAGYFPARKAAYLNPVECLRF